MPSFILQYWAQWLFGLLSGGLVAFATYVRSKFKRLNAMEAALRASMYDRLYYLHGRFMQQGWISVPDFENISGIYQGYHGLGGNGVGTKLYADLSKLPNFEPKEIS